MDDMRSQLNNFPICFSIEFYRCTQCLKSKCEYLSMLKKYKRVLLGLVLLTRLNLYELALKGIILSNL